jgi:hypothetical protein
VNCEVPSVNGQPSTAASRSSAGFTILEVTIATGLLVAIALGSAQLFGLALHHNVSAKHQLVMSLAAAHKADELCAAAAAGPVAASPPDALERGADGFADVTVESGVSCVRRWLVRPPAGYEAVVLAVVVRVSVAGSGDAQIATVCAGAAS